MKRQFPLARRSWWWPIVAAIAGLFLVAIVTVPANGGLADDDRDGVFNVADKCLNTQKGARVNEAGCSGAQDQDGDTVTNLNDKCPAVKGPASNNGCPEKPKTPRCNPNKAIAAALEVDEDDLLVGKNKVKWDRAPEAQPMNAFSDQELSSQAKLGSFVRGDSRGSREARKIVRSALSDAQEERALNEGGWRPVQLKGDQTVKLKGNYQLIGGDVVKRASTSQPGEVLWFYVPTNCTGDTGEDVDIKVAIRAWCGNPQVFGKV